MPSTHTITLRFPIPPSLPPTTVLTHLQTYEPLITPNPYLVRHARRPTRVEEIVHDPFFTADGTKLEAWEITDRITFLPVPGMKKMLSKLITVPAVFQSFETGIRLRAEAQAGVRVYSRYEVLPKRRAVGGEEEGKGGEGGEGSEGDEYEFVETSSVHCSPLLMPFVSRTFESGHRSLCQKFLDELYESFRNGRMAEQQDHIGTTTTTAAATTPAPTATT